MNNLKLSIQLLIYILSTLVVVFTLAILLITLNVNKMTFADAQQLMQGNAREYALLTESYFNKDFGAARALAYAFQGYRAIDATYRRQVYDDYLANVFKYSKNYIAVWASYELWAFDDAWKKPYGRVRTEVIKNENSFSIKRDSLNLNGDNAGSLYYSIKLTNSEVLTDPYTYTYTGKKEDEILEASICVPITIDGKFGGLVGMDVPLTHFQQIILQFKPFEQGYAFLLSNNGTVVAHPNEEFIGAAVSNIYSDIEKQHKISRQIYEGKEMVFTAFDPYSKQASNFCLVPINLANTNKKWSIGIAVPTSVIQSKAMQNLYFSIIIGILGLFIVTVLIWIISRNIVSLLNRTTFAIKKIAAGEIATVEKLPVKGRDEISEMAGSLNSLIDGLNNTVNFAKQIGAGNLKSEFNLLSDKDELGIALLDMRKSLIEADLEEKKRQKEDEKRNWTANGLAKFAVLLRFNYKNTTDLTYNIIRELVNYLKVDIGGIFLLNDENPNEKFLEWSASYAFDRRKFLNKNVDIKEGLLGACYLEKKSIYLTEIPDNYITISSGMGFAEPKCILITPLKLNENIYGVLELASFRLLQPFEIEFVEKVGESIASAISATKINARTNQLLEESQQRAEQMREQEEEMRQNLEELAATQEALGQKDELQRKEIESLNQKYNDKIIEIENREQQTRSILESCLDAVIIIGDDGIIEFFNQSAEKLWKFKKEEVIGKNVNFLMADDIAAAHNQFIFNYLNTGHKKMLGNPTEVNIKKKDNTFAPVLLSITETKINEAYVFTAFIKDLTDQKKAEEDLKQKDIIQKNEIDRLTKEHQNQLAQLKLQEEKLLQNMEELTITQDEIKKAHAHIESTFNAINQTIGAVEYSIDGIILSVNNHFVNKLKCASSNELLNKRYTDFFSQEEVLSSNFLLFWEEVKHGKSLCREKMYRLQNGEIIWFQETFAPIRDNKNNVIKILCLLNDITSIKETQLNMQETINAIDATVGFVELNPNGIVINCNDLYFEGTGHKKEDFIGINRKEIVSEKVANSSEYQQFWDDILNGEIKKWEKKFTLPNGTYVWKQETFTPLKDINNKVYKVLCTAVDITEIKENEVLMKDLLQKSEKYTTQLKENENTLQAKMLELQQVYDDLKQKQQEKDRLYKKQMIKNIKLSTFEKKFENMEKVAREREAELLKQIEELKKQLNQ